MSDTTHTHTHETGYGSYVLVWLGLVALTAITVTIAGINFGSVTLISALMIAIAKTIMVVNYFMHVKFDKKMLKMFILMCVGLYIVFIILTFADLSFR